MTRGGVGGRAMRTPDNETSTQYDSTFSPRYASRDVIKMVRRELGEDWLAVTDEIANITQSYEEDYSRLPEEEIQRIRGLMPLARHPFLNQTLRERLAQENPRELAKLRRECTGLIKKTQKALRLWNAAGLNPNPFFER